MSLYKSTDEDYLTRRMPARLKRAKICRDRFEGEASLTDCGEGSNLSPRRLPRAAVRAPRGLLSEAVGSGTPHGMAVFNGDLYVARGQELYRVRDGAWTRIGAVSDTDKRFFVFGERLYVYPDKVYLDAGGTELLPMELDSGVLTEKTTFKGSTVTLPGGKTWKSLGFAPGDCLRVENGDDDMPAPEGYYRILTLVGRMATVAESFPATYESRARFRRVVPDLERVCVSGDRVYGTNGQEVYVSAAGSALDFYSRGTGDGSGAALRLSSDGDITACAVGQGSVIFFKQDSICKLLGSRADNFTLQERPGVGVPAELADSLCEVAGDLYYAARGGVYRYRGQESERISPLGDAAVQDAVGGTDGAAYYLSLCRAGAWRQFCYLPGEGRWFPEDTMAPAAMIRYKGFLCIQDGSGALWLTSADGRDTGCGAVEEMVCGELILPPDYELQPEGCRPVEVAVRADCHGGGVLEIFAEFADGSSADGTAADGSAGKDTAGRSTVLLGRAEGAMVDRLLRFPVTPRHCDGVRISLRMTGDWTIHAVTRVYEV